MKIAVCDDETVFRDQISSVLEGYYGKLDVTCIPYEDGMKLCNAYQNESEFDVIFLDIEMPLLDGMETARSLRQNGFAGPIIFLTSHTKLAMDGYEVAAFRFLPKPIQKEKMLQTLQDLKLHLYEQKKMVVHYEGEDIVLNVEDICYVEAMNNSVSIVLSDRSYLVRKKIADMEEELRELSEFFVRVHRGYIVNLSHVKKQKGNEIFVTGFQMVPISRRMLKSFKEKLLEYVRKSAR